MRNSEAEMAGRRGVFAAVAVAGCACAVGWVAPAHAASLKASRPHVVSLAVTPTRLPGRGGRVTLRARVSGGSTCSFYGQASADDVVDVVSSVPCRAGRASATVRVEANSHRRAVRLSFSVIVTDAVGRSARRASVVVQAAGPKPPPPPPPALAVDTTALPDATPSTPYSATLTASAGVPPYRWSVTSGVLPPGLTLTPTGTITGTPTATGVSPFTVTVADSSARTAAAFLSIAVMVPPPDLPPDQETSGNWSGYVDVGGPYTAVAGTFNVPKLVPSATRSVTSEWVGIDGANNANLIQAGVEQDYDPIVGGEVEVAWWEILPAPETAVFDVPIAPGDSVTISIAELRTGLWKIAILDNTNGKQFTRTQNYAGEGTSAEWIVEAPTNGDSGSIETLSPFTPNVTFAKLLVDGPTTSTALITMTQHHTAVATPSGLSPNGFSVAYGATAPLPP